MVVIALQTNISDLTTNTSLNQFVAFAAGALQINGVGRLAFRALGFVAAATAPRHLFVAMSAPLTVNKVGLVAIATQLSVLATPAPLHNRVA